MKKYTLMILLATGLSAGAQMPSLHYFPAKPSQQKSSAPLPPQVWRSGTEVVYELADGEELTLSEVHKRTYNERGDVLTDELTSFDETGAMQGVSLSTYTYAQQRSPYTECITQSSADGLTWVNRQRVTRRYDEICPRVIIDNGDYAWLNNAWNKNGNNYTRTITRDAAGNVTSVVIAPLYMGVYDPIDRTTITYGADGKAIEILQEGLTSAADGSLVWRTSAHYTDIVWHHTDGQITDVSLLPTVANGMTSARVLISEDNWGDLSFTYPDEQGSYNSTLTGRFDGVPTTIKARLEVLDPWGSYDYTQDIVTGLGSISETYATTEKWHYDEYGLETLIYQSESYNGMESIYNWTIGKVTYSSEYQYPVEYIISEYDPYEETSVDILRATFSDYIDCAGVADAGVDSSDAPARYYDLRGIEVAEPTAPGIYIERRGTATRKLIVR